MAVWRLYVMSYQAELRTITRIRALGEYKGQVYSEPRGQYLFRQLFGDRLSQRAVSVHLFSEEVDDGWIKEYLSGLRHVEILNINSPNVTDEGLSHLGAERTCSAGPVVGQWADGARKPKLLPDRKFEFRDGVWASRCIACPCGLRSKRGAAALSGGTRCR